MKRSEMDKLRMFVAEMLNKGWVTVPMDLRRLLDTLTVDQEDVPEVPLSEESRKAVEAGLKDAAEGRTSLAEEDFSKYVEED